MANCPHCNGEIDNAAEKCPHCGERVIPAGMLEKISTKTTHWQKIFIIVSIIVLVAIGFTYQGAMKREEKAAQLNFQQPMERVVKAFVAHSGLARQFGQPKCLLKAETDSAIMHLEFSGGPFSQLQAGALALSICESMARLYVQKGYQPTHLEVYVDSLTKNGKLTYGHAVFNGNTGSLEWVPGK